MYITLVVETFGLWLKLLVFGCLTALTFRNQLHEATSHLHQQLSIKFRLYNSKMVLEKLAFESRKDVFGLI